MWPNVTKLIINPDITELHVKRIGKGLVSQTALRHCPVAVDIPR